MSGNRVLGERDVNVTMTDAQPFAKDVKSMEYHRQVLQSRIAQEPYVTDLLLHDLFQAIHLPVRHHHESLHGKTFGTAQQTSLQVGLVFSLSLELPDPIINLDEYSIELTRRAFNLEPNQSPSLPKRAQTDSKARIPSAHSPLRARARARWAPEKPRAMAS
ncbi:hypothetical protein TGAM01_v204418 [Trichoderma gamsii]|uniref:Uncharacterized protein n=1 Tax=Trichoderma gamsii TaxID=398673 RepID=A0A2P4ZRK0_9HYPO|nr:hypothetical protein TGAM01_v204418 [Trichoderma gamsii]PON26917.1 hypothetical protein TGAM01_v204418 [Trichoderma gamsii]